MNVLAIGAHYDDIELGAGGTIAKHISNGDNVTLVVVTDSSYSGFDNKVLRTKEQAHQEGAAAAKILGANRPICLEYETKRVVYGADLIEDLNKIIVDNKIEIIYTHWIHDVHQDHSAIGKATLNAARHVPRILMYRSNWYITSHQFIENFFVDITPHISKKIKSIEAHKSECEKRGEKWMKFVLQQNYNTGIKMGLDYAEGFEVVKWLM
jgi:LmbE family N-acetylglucosaminyl deacetylase